MACKDPAKKKENDRLYRERMKLNPAWIIYQRSRLRKYRTAENNREQFQKIKRDPEKYEREGIRKSVQARRAREANAKGSHSIQQWLWRVQYFGWRCFYCKIQLT